MTDNLLKYFYITVIAIILAGCDKRPEGVLSDSEMVDFLTDMSVAEAIQQSAAGSELPDSVRRRIGYSVMKAHGIDRSTLDSTYAWYSENVDIYYDLYEKVEKNINKELKRSGIDKNSGLDNNIWNLQSHIVFSPIGASDALIFRMPGSSVGKGEKMQWRMNFNKSTDAGVTIGIDYEDGSASVVTRTLKGERKLDVSVIADTARTPLRVFGSIRIRRKDMPVLADSVVLLRLPFDSTEFNAFRYQKFLTGPRRRKVPTKDAEEMNSNTDSIVSDSSSDRNISKNNSIESPSHIKMSESKASAPASASGNGHKLHNRHKRLSSDAIPGSDTDNKTSKKTANKKRL